MSNSVDSHLSPPIAALVALATRMPESAIAPAMALIRSHFSTFDVGGAWERVPLAERRGLFVLAGLDGSPLFDQHWRHLPARHQLAIRRSLFAVADYVR